MLAEVAEVLLELVSWQKAHGVDWVRSAVQKLPQDRAAVATEQQCWQFHQYAVRCERRLMPNLLYENVDDSAFKLA